MAPILKATFVNLGVQGQLLSIMVANAATEVDPLFTTGAVAFILGGTNDLLNNGGTATTIYNDLVTWATGRRSAGFKVIVGTLPDSTLYSGAQQTERANLRASILADTTHFDGVADFGGDVNVGVTGSAANTTYFNVDGLHPNDLGAAIEAGIARLALWKVSPGN